MAVSFPEVYRYIVSAAVEVSVVPCQEMHLNKSQNIQSWKGLTGILKRMAHTGMVSVRTVQMKSVHILCDQQQPLESEKNDYMSKARDLKKYLNWNKPHFCSKEEIRRIKWQKNLSK